MKKRILIMGLPGAGKTTLAVALSVLLSSSNTIAWLNADSIRKKYNDWDFSTDGRLRQAQRMRELADQSTSDYAICDFVAPLPEMRDIFAADLTIWIDTIQHSRYQDTNVLFVKPELFDFRITEQDSIKWANIIVDYLLNSGTK